MKSIQKKYSTALFVCFLAILIFYSFQSLKNQTLEKRPPTILQKSTNNTNNVSFIEHGSRSKKEVALTFDADMTPKMQKEKNQGRASYFDPKIVDTLKTNQVPATIFVTGLWAINYGSELKEIASDTLFEIGNHSYSHRGFTPGCYRLANLDDSEKEDDISKSQDAIEKVIGHKPKLFRFPGGCYKEQDLSIVQKYGLTVVAWDVVGGDAFNKNSTNIVEKIEKKVEPGSIIVLHLGGKNSPATATALPKIIQDIKAQGYVFVKVSQMIGL